MKKLDFIAIGLVKDVLLGFMAVSLRVNGDDPAIPQIDVEMFHGGSLTAVSSENKVAA